MSLYQAAYFAVALDWRSFHDLLGLLETQREALAAYIDRAEADPRLSPQALVGLRPGQTADGVEREFVEGLDPDAWSRAADGFAAGSANDRKIAELMRASAPPTATLQALTPLFFNSEGEPRTAFGTKSAPPKAVAYLSSLAADYGAALERQRAARVADETVKALTLARVHHALYALAKERRGALDFADLVARTVDLLTRRATAAWVLYKLDGGIEHVLVDEAQDTAPEQWAIFKALTEEFFSGAGSRHAARDAARIPRTVFAVGDEKQSIYSFQGARPERLREERRDYMERAEGAGRPFVGPALSTSFRSTEDVLRFVDAAFEGPERSRALVGETGELTRHQAARIGQRGAVDLWPLFRDPPVSDRQAWEPVDAESSRSGRKVLAQTLAREIRRQVESGVTVHDHRSDGGRRPARWGDFLILVRRRDATFEEIIRALKTERVPVAGADRLKLKAHIVFADLLSLARFALFPDDDLSLAEVLRGPLCDLTDFGDDHSLYPLADAEARQGASLWSNLNRRAGEQPQWSAARDFLTEMIGRRARDPFAFFSSALMRIGPDGRSGRARILARLGHEAEEALDETLAQVLAAEGRGGTDLETCVALLENADVIVKREMEAARDEVRVMTVHGAKGLEAPVVILPDTTSRAKPQGPTLMPVDAPDGGEGWLMCPSRSTEDCAASREARAARAARTDAEALRLLYVALTRARDRLILMGRALRRPEAGFEAKSWWDVLSETFDRLSVETGDVRDVGDGARRFGHDPEELPAYARPLNPASLELPAWLRRSPAPDLTGRLASPSSMGAGAHDPATSPLAAAGGRGMGRFRRGELIHRLLERLPDLPTDARLAAARRMMARERDLDDDQRDEMISAAFAVLNDPRFAPVFGPGSRAEAALTGTSPELPNAARISGRIDRLIVSPDRVLVIDYKTNRPPPARVEEVDPAYVLQLATYAAVLRRLYPNRAIEAALVWTEGPSLMPVPEEAMAAALAAAR